MDKTIRIQTKKYVRPQTTKTDLMQDYNDYKKKLDGYDAIDNIDHEEVGTYVRYFVWCVQHKKWLFRFGGYIKNLFDDYVVLRNNKKHSWCVQKSIRDNMDVYPTKFFKSNRSNKILAHTILQTLQQSQQFKSNHVQPDVEEENKKLYKENQKLRKQAASLPELEKQNEVLIQYIKEKSRTRTDSTMSRSISHSQSTHLNDQIQPGVKRSHRGYHSMKT